MVLKNVLSSVCIVGFVFYLSILKINGDEDWSFPAGFIIGAATASYQTEGAWNISDKGESVWDLYTHTRPERIRDGDNGDIACNSYHKFKENIQLLKKLGASVNHYRFSLSWPRILPTGYANVVSKDGIKYYNDVLDELEKNNIIPFVTIYHWDHPQVFQDIGGWTNEAMVDLFGDYARVVFREFRHRVKLFVTINEPSVVCENGYFTGVYAPGLQIGRHAEYLCTHNIIKAHARAYHIYNDEFKAQTTRKTFQYQCGRYAGPIFSKTGDYPEIIKQRIDENSKYEGLERSRLPKFSEEWIKYIKDSADYLGLNHYSSKLVAPAPKPNNTVYINDHGLIYSYNPKWISTPTEDIKLVPQGFTDLLRKIKDEYDNPLLYVTENGLSDLGTTDDAQRIQYYYLYMKAMLTAIKKYGCNVQGYTMWSLLDNFEWELGYSSKFGLHQVDFNNPNRTRIPKKSVSWLAEVLRNRKVKPMPENELSPNSTIVNSISISSE